MTKQKIKKFIHEGHYAAEVDIERIETGKAWEPYISLEDAYKLDTVREALRHEDIKSASSLARVYTLNLVKKLKSA
jgi:hypothetical protein